MIPSSLASVFRNDILQTAQILNQEVMPLFSISCPHLPNLNRNAHALGSGSGSSPSPFFSHHLILDARLAQGAITGVLEEEIGDQEG